VSVDPADSEDLEFPSSLNRYIYVLNDPINWVDPDGLCPEGMREATDEEAAAIAEIAKTYLDKDIEWSKGKHYDVGSDGKLRQIDCSGLLCQAQNGNAYSDPFTPDKDHNTTSALPGYETTSNPRVGDIVQFKGHVGIVVSTNPLKFVGSQTSTGPAIVDMSIKTPRAWGSKPHQFYTSCVPNGGLTLGSGGLNRNTKEGPKSSRYRDALMEYYVRLQNLAMETARAAQKKAKEVVTVVIKYN
jgi:hypothetical protein